MTSVSKICGHELICFEYRFHIVPKERNVPVAIELTEELYDENSRI